MLTNYSPSSTYSILNAFQSTPKDVSSCSSVIGWIDSVLQLYTVGPSDKPFDDRAPAELANQLNRAMPQDKFKFVVMHLNT